MYNPELKNEFIKSYAKSLAGEHPIVSFFRRTEAMEAELGKDLCNFSTEELQKLFDSFGHMQYNSVAVSRGLYRAYVKFAGERIHGVSDRFDGVLISFADANDKFVGSPEHLQIILDGRFLAESKLGVDNVYRALFWIAFSGVCETDAPEISGSCIDLENLEILYSGHSYPIYDQAVECISNCMKMREFRFEHSFVNGCIKEYTMQRVDGDQLLRGTTSAALSQSWKKRMSTYKPLRSRTECKTPIYLYIWKSGIFYRAYQRELAGLPVDFSDPVNAYMRERDYNLDSLHGKIQYRKQRMNKQFGEEYANWKEQFAL